MGLVENLFDKKVSHPSIFEQKTTYTRSQVLVVSTLEKSEVPCFIRIHHKHNLKMKEMRKIWCFFSKINFTFCCLKRCWSRVTHFKASSPCFKESFGWCSTLLFLAFGKFFIIFPPLKGEIHIRFLILDKHCNPCSQKKQTSS